MKRRLYRSRHDRIIAGVCSGIADYFDIDPTVVRLIWVLLTLPGFVHGILAYFICWAVIPPEPAGTSV